MHFASAGSAATSSTIRNGLISRSRWRERRRLSRRQHRRSGANRTVSAILPSGLRDVHRGLSRAPARKPRRRPTEIRASGGRLIAAFVAIPARAGAPACTSLPDCPARNVGVLPATCPGLNWPGRTLGRPRSYPPWAAARRQRYPRPRNVLRNGLISKRAPAMMPLSLPEGCMPKAEVGAAPRQNCEPSH